MDEIKESTATMPLLGYTVIASLDSSLEVSFADLQQTLMPLGFGSDDLLPPAPEPRTYVRRAITAWIKEMAQEGTGTTVDLFEEDETGHKTKPLVREVKIRDKAQIVLALVSENVDLAAMGLSYLTNLRVFYVKPKKDKDGQETPGVLNLTLTPSGATDAHTHVPDDQEQTLLDGLQKHIEHYAETYKTQELTRMVKKIIESMNATTMRPSGGVYFVPYQHRDQLARLKTLVEQNLTAPTGKTTSTLMHLPVVDEANTKAQVSRSAHQTFVSKAYAFEVDMQRFLNNPANRQRGIHKNLMEKRIEDMEAVKNELDLYGKLLGVQREEIAAKLDKMEDQARELINLYAIGVKRERETAGVAAATAKPLPTDDEDEDEDDE